MAAPEEPTASDRTAHCMDTIVERLASVVPEMRGAFRTHRAAVDSDNPSGEQMLAADVYADQLFEEHLGMLDCVGTYASEERADTTDFGDGLSVAVDPLDGSSNLGSNNGVGTIVGVYDRDLPARGRDLVGAAYVLYGPSTTAMVATDAGVTEYIFEDGHASILTADVELEQSGTVYGFGGPVPEWSRSFRQYAMETQRRLKRRYGGALVGDVNQVLSHGGVFAYPALSSRPEGKLRHQFEGNPIAYIVEQAGGDSFDGEESVLDRDPDRLHGRTPLFVGSSEPMDRLVETLGGTSRNPGMTTRESAWPDEQY